MTIHYVFAFVVVVLFAYVISLRYALRMTSDKLSKRNASLKAWRAYAYELENVLAVVTNERDSVTFELSKLTGKVVKLGKVDPKDMSNAPDMLYAVPMFDMDQYLVSRDSDGKITGKAKASQYELSFVPTTGTDGESSVAFGYVPKPVKESKLKDNGTGKDSKVKDNGKNTGKESSKSANDKTSKTDIGEFEAVPSKLTDDQIAVLAKVLVDVEESAGRAMSKDEYAWLEAKITGKWAGKAHADMVKWTSDYMGKNK